MDINTNPIAAAVWPGRQGRFHCHLLYSPNLFFAQSSRRPRQSRPASLALIILVDKNLPMLYASLVWLGVAWRGRVRRGMVGYGMGGGQK